MPRRVTTSHSSDRWIAVGVVAWALVGTAVCPAVADSSHDAHSGTVSPSNPVMANVPKGRSIPTLRRVDSSLDARDPLANSLRNPQIDLASPLDFRDLYAVEGRDDVFVRRSGAVYAVFPRSYFVREKKQEVTRVPGGTTYSIGFPQALKIAPQRPGRARPAGHAGDAHIDHAIDCTIDTTATATRLDQRVELGIDRAGVGHEGEERNTLEPATKSTSSGETMTSETSEMSDAPAAVAASQTASNDALPRFIASESYRRARLGTLLQQAGATSTSAPKP